MGAVSPPLRRPEDPALDADLLRRIRAGDRTAVDDLYERFRRPAFALARRILANDSLAEDVLQEVFLGVWRDPSAYDLCSGHAARLKVPVGWALEDRRTPIIQLRPSIAS